MSWYLIFITGALFGQLSIIVAEKLGEYAAKKDIERWENDKTNH